MAFAPIGRRTIRFAPAQGDGIEHLDIVPDADGVAVTSVVAGSYEGTPFGLRYRLALDAGWRLRRAELGTTAGAHLLLEADGAGRWTDGAGVVRDDLAGAIDIDIVATPFTNTLPIRRLAFSRGESRDIAAAWISLPDFAVQREPQRYTALEPGRLYRFLALDGGFTADLPVDEDGIVTDYPGLFRRARP